MKNKTCDAIVLAAGNSRRFNSTLPKQFLKINNKNLIDIAIDNLKYLKKIRNIYVVLKKNNPYKASTDINIIIGGTTRTKSVFKSLKFVFNTKDIPDSILIHDAARPCLDSRDLKELFAKGNNSTTGLSLGYPLTNALKKVNSKLEITDNIKRDNLLVILMRFQKPLKKLFLIIIA